MGATKHTAKRLASGAAASLLLAYLLLSRGLWLADLERQVQIGKNRLSKAADVTQPQIMTWKISGDEWNYVGECRIALVLDRIPTIPAESYQKSSRALQVRVGAYAIPYESSKTGLRADRLIKNSYYTTDLPFSPQARIWESSDSRSVELGLGGAHRYEFEDTYIVLEVMNPDPALAAGNPRLEIFGEHDFAVYSHIWQLRIIRDAILLFLACCVVGLTYSAWRNLS